MYGEEKNTNKINTNISFYWVIYNKIKKTHDRDIYIYIYVKRLFFKNLTKFWDNYLLSY